MEGLLAMASNTWVAKLNYMRKLEGVHKWEKRWVSKGSIMVSHPLSLHPPPCCRTRPD